MNLKQCRASQQKFMNSLNNTVRKTMMTTNHTEKNEKKREQEQIINYIFI